METDRERVMGDEEEKEEGERRRGREVLVEFVFGQRVILYETYLKLNISQRFHFFVVTNAHHLHFMLSGNNYFFLINPSI